MSQTIYTVRSFENVPEFKQSDPDAGTYLLETNDKNIVLSMFNGSQVPMAAYVGQKFLASNFNLLAARALLKKSKQVVRRQPAPRRRRSQGVVRP